MLPDAYKEWVSIYNDDFKEKWESEKLELRKVSMIYYAFEKEIEKLKASMNNEIKEVRSELRRRDLLQKRKHFSGLAETLGYDLDQDINKENETPGITQIGELKSEKFVIESPDTEECFENRHTPPPLLKTNFEANSSSPSLLKNYRKRQASATPPLKLCPVISRKVDTSPKAPQDCDETVILESSIIEQTPELKHIKKNKNSKLLSKKKTDIYKNISQHKQNTTLTQMFFEPSKKKKKKELESNGPSMSITAMIDLINQSSGSETDDGLDKSDDTLGNSFENLSNKLKTPESKKDPDISLNFIENYDKLPDKKKKSPDFVYHDVVRGKERNKLKGWSCSECENYYKGLNLPPEELEKKKDHCSRHRHRFQPREETYQGFWDLTFGPSPKTQKQQK